MRPDAEFVFRLLERKELGSNSSVRYTGIHGTVVPSIYSIGPSSGGSVLRHDIIYK